VSVSRRVGISEVYVYAYAYYRWLQNVRAALVYVRQSCAEFSTVVREISQALRSS